MASKNTKMARNHAVLSSLIGDVEKAAERCKTILAIDNRLRKPEMASTSTIKCTVKTARAAKNRAKRPYVVNKH